MNESVEINGKIFPANLKILLDSGNQGDYEKKDVYYLELNKELADIFSAYVSGTFQKRIIFTTDKDFIIKVWKELSRRPLTIASIQFFVHKESSIGYIIKCHKEEESFPMLLLTEKDYLSLVEKNHMSMEWHLGPVERNILEATKTNFAHI
jgi:hypothetical protein